MLKPLILFYIILNSTCCSPQPLAANNGELHRSASDNSFDESIDSARSVPSNSESIPEHDKPVKPLRKRSFGASRIDQDDHKLGPPPNLNHNRRVNSAAEFVSSVDSATNLNHQPELSSTADANLMLKGGEDVDLEEAIKLKCYLNIIHSLRKMNFVDLLLVRRERIRSEWYRRNEHSCRRLLQFKSSPTESFRIFPGLIELKIYKLKLTFTLIKWKLDAMLKFKVWFLVIIMRFKQAIFGRNVIRDEDISLLVRLFFPELFSSQNAGITDSFKQLIDV